MPSSSSLYLIGHGGNADTSEGKTDGTQSGDANGGNGANGGTTPENNPARSIEDFSLTADNIKTNITFDNQGGTGIDNTTLYMGYTGAGDDSGIAITPPTKTDYGFLGYYIEENGDGKLIYDSLGNLKNANEKISLDGKWIRTASDEQDYLTLYTYWKPTYNINVSNDTNGTISSDKTIAYSDDEILLTVTPNIDYELDYYEILSVILRLLIIRLL